MKALITLSLMAALALGLVGCKKDEKPAAPAEQAAPAEADEPEEATEPPQAAGTDEPAAPVREPEPPIKVLSVEEHMAEVSKQITADNYKEELARLESQIGRRVERSAGAVRPAVPAPVDPAAAPGTNEPTPPPAP